MIIFPYSELLIAESHLNRDRQVHCDYKSWTVVPLWDELFVVINNKRSPFVWITKYFCMQLSETDTLENSLAGKKPTPGLLLQNNATYNP